MAARGVDCKLRRRLLSTVQLYKCVGDQQSLPEYLQAHPLSGGRDWSALYLQFDEDHALATSSYRWRAGYASANLLRITVRDLPVLIVDAEWMPSAEIPGDEKSAAVRDALGLSSCSLPLMEAVAAAGNAMICRETEHQWELLVGPRLEFNVAETEVVMQVRPDKYECTAEYRRAGPAAKWLPFQYSMQDLEPPAWIMDAIAAEDDEESQPEP